MSESSEAKHARKGQTIGLVIAVTMVCWFVLTVWVGPAIGLPGRFVFLFDFAALAILLRALVALYQMWRARSASHI